MQTHGDSYLLCLIEFRKGQSKERTRQANVLLRTPQAAALWTGAPHLDLSQAHSHVSMSRECLRLALLTGSTGLMPACPSVNRRHWTEDTLLLDYLAAVQTM